MRSGGGTREDFSHSRLDPIVAEMRLARSDARGRQLPGRSPQRLRNVQLLLRRQSASEFERDIRFRRSHGAMSAGTMGPVNACLHGCRRTHPGSGNERNRRRAVVAPLARRRRPSVRQSSDLRLSARIAIASRQRAATMSTASIAEPTAIAAGENPMTQSYRAWRHGSTWW